MPSLVTGHLLSLAHVFVGAGGTCLRLRSCHLLSLTHVLVDVRGTCLPWLLATCVIIGTCLRWRSWYKSSLAFGTRAIAASTELIRCHLHVDWSSMLLLRWCIVFASLSCIGSYDFARFGRHMCLFVLSQDSFACSRLVSLATGCVPQMTRFPRCLCWLRGTRCHWLLSSLAQSSLAPWHMLSLAHVFVGSVAHVIIGLLLACGSSMSLR